MSETDEAYTLAPQSPRLSYILYGKEVVGHLEKVLQWRWVHYDTPAKNMKAVQKNFQPKIRDQRGGYARSSGAFWAFQHYHKNLTKEAQ